MNLLRAIRTAIRRTIFTRLLGFAIVLAVALTGATGATATTPTPSSPAAISSRPIPPLQYPTRQSNLAPIINQAASDATSYGKNSLPDIFGGVWLDRKGTVAHILLKDTSGANTSRITQNIRHPELVVYDKAQFSEKELLDIQKRVLADDGKLRAQGIEVAGTGEKISENKLIIDVVSTTAAKTNTASTVLPQLYGNAAVSVQAISAPHVRTDRAGGYPYKDGYQLAPAGSSPNCTLGFIGYSSTSWEIITAGHCYSVGTTVTTPGIGTIGNVDRNGYYTNSRTDAASIGFGGYDIGTQHNLIRNDPNIAAVVEVELQQYQNKFVCKSGKTTDQTCFYVNRVHYTNNVGGVVLPDQVEALASAGSVDYGDSGGPVYMPLNQTQVSAEGIVSAKNGDGSLMYYSFVYNLAPDMGLYIWRG